MDPIQTAANVEMPVDDVTDANELLQPGQPNGGEMGELPVEDWDYQRPQRGQVRSGVILAIENQEIIVDVGAKRDGVVPYGDLQRLGGEALATLKVGDRLPVYILQPEDRDGNLLVSLYLARQDHAWQRARELADSGESWEAQVVGYNKGGLVVPIGDIRGFVPASQVPGLPRGLDEEERIKHLAAMVGETFRVKVMEINRRKRRLILSATAAQREQRQEHRDRLLDELREGEVRRGRVSSLCAFGAFVDLGGADGLVHLSELSWRQVRHPKEVVNVGDEVEVFVLRLDRERNRIALSLKRLQPEPWSLVEDQHELGQLVQGVVTNVADFGAFVQIEEGVEGLIHISELTEASISHPRDVVRRGDLLLLRIIRIDPRRKRLGLSLKRVLESEWAEWAARLAAEESSKPVAARKARPRPSPAPESEPPPEAAVPSAEQPEPAAEAAVPSAEEVEPAAEAAMPSAEEAEPAVEAAVPSAEEAEPTAEAAVPSAQEAAPATEEAVPVTEEAPVASTVSPQDVSSDGSETAQA